MIFRKTERKKLPTILGISVGALAVLGAMSIKEKGSDMCKMISSKMKKLGKKKSSAMDDIMECELP